AGHGSFCLRRGHRGGQGNDCADTQDPDFHSQAPYLTARVFFAFWEDWNCTLVSPVFDMESRDNPIPRWAIRTPSQTKTTILGWGRRFEMCAELLLVVVGGVGDFLTVGSGATRFERPGLAVAGDRNAPGHGDLTIHLVGELQRVIVDFGVRPAIRAGVSSQRIVLAIELARPL